MLDAGCGPGRSAVQLARWSGATAVRPVLALDLEPRMLARTRARAREAGAAVLPVRGDLGALPFRTAAFDLAWAEASIYVVGFRAGLRALARVVAPGGCVVVSEAIWRTRAPSAEALAFWSEYDEIAPLDGKREDARAAGYEVLADFPLPDAAWVDEYYAPLRARVEACRARWPSAPETDALLAAATREIELFERRSAEYGYAFLVLRRR